MIIFYLIQNYLYVCLLHKTYLYLPAISKYSQDFLFFIDTRPKYPDTRPPGIRLF
jgi:hypothetical protein